MNDTVNQLVASHKASMETLTALTTQAFAGVEKLVDLNMAASRAALTQSFSHLSGAIGMKDPKDLLSLQSGLLKPLADKTAACAEHLQALVMQSGVEFAKAMEARSALAQEVFASAQANFTTAAGHAADAVKKATRVV